MMQGLCYLKRFLQLILLKEIIPFNSLENIIKSFSTKKYAPFHCILLTKYRLKLWVIQTTHKLMLKSNIVVMILKS